MAREPVRELIIGAPPHLHDGVPGIICSYLLDDLGDNVEECSAVIAGLMQTLRTLRALKAREFPTKTLYSATPIAVEVPRDRSYRSAGIESVDYGIPVLKSVSRSGSSFIPSTLNAVRHVVIIKCFFPRTLNVVGQVIVAITIIANAVLIEAMSVAMVISFDIIV